MEWYALFVETGMEDIVQKGIRRHFDETELHAVVPKRRLPERRNGITRQVLKTMFPGYVLIHTRMDVDIYYRLKDVPHCIRVLKHNGSYYTKIGDEEIRVVSQLWDSEGIVEPSSIFFAGSRVIVKSGPLQGLEAMIKKVDKRKNRAKILLPFMGQEQLMDVGIEILGPVSTPPGIQHALTASQSLLAH
jgi:transcription termination/antitermination protein NusG